MNLVSISFPLWCLKSQDPRCKTQTASLRLIDDYDFDRRAIYCSKARLNILLVRLARVRVVLGSNEQAVAGEAGRRGWAHPS